MHTVWDVVFAGDDILDVRDAIIYVLAEFVR